MSNLAFDKYCVGISEHIEKPAEGDVAILLVRINLKDVSFLGRCLLLPWNLSAPWLNLFRLQAEFKEWSSKGLLCNRWEQLLYILDHWVFFYFYVLQATLFGYAEGMSWKIKGGENVNGKG